VAKTGVTFPEGYKDTFTKYHTINFPATKQVRHYYANKAAAAAAKAGKPLPDGSVLFTEVYVAKLDADGKPAMGGDGYYVADKLLLYTAMAREAGWGKDIPEMLRNARAPTLPGAVTPAPVPASGFASIRPAREARQPV
jgi:hypothetical protein